MESAETLSTAKVKVVVESDLYNGKKITDCKQINVTYTSSSDLEQKLKDGWELVMIAWVRDENTNYGHEPAVMHVLRAVIVKTENAQ